MDELRSEFDDGQFRVVTWRNVLINVWCGALTSARLDMLLVRERALCARCPRGIAVASIVVGVPVEMLRTSDEARDRAAAIHREMEPHTLGMANVVLGSGFWAATVHGIMSAVYLFNKPSYPVKTFGDLDAAAAWLSPLAARGAAAPVDPASLRAALERSLRDIPPS